MCLEGGAKEGGLRGRSQHLSEKGIGTLGDVTDSSFPELHEQAKERQIIASKVTLHNMGPLNISLARLRFVFECILGS